MPDKGDELYHGYKPVYREAVETVKAADPKVLVAVHELLFSGFGLFTCDNAEKICLGNKAAHVRLSDLLLETINERNVA